MTADLTLPLVALLGLGNTRKAFVKHARAGGVFAYPTSTVYGLGTVLEEGAVRELATLKRRSEAKPFLVISTHRESFEALAWTASACRLADQFWPGRLTLVLGDPDGAFPAPLRGAGGGVAVRQSANPVVRAVEWAVGSPLTSTSANAPGLAPALDAIEARIALETLGAQHSWVVDGGQLRPSAPSTIVDCTVEPPRLLREGTFSLQEVERGLDEESAHRAIDPPDPFSILFVCTGNTCRSPMAEVIAQSRINELGWAAEATSAGVFAARGAPPSPDSAAVAESHGLNLDAHVARRLDVTLVENADLILTMGPGHVDAVQGLGAGGKVALLSAFADGSDDPLAGSPVVDPIGMGREVYEATYEELRQLIDRALLRLGPLLAVGQ